MKQRCFRVLRTACFLLAAGAAYGIFVLQTGIGMVCPIYFVTGWKCPGCGVTRMCTALLQLKFAEAFSANPVLLLLSPVLAVLFLKYIADYVKTGCWKMSVWQNVLMWICIAVLIVYGICRNIFPIP